MNFTNYDVFSYREHGASHIKKGAPNQDYITHKQEEDFIIISASDGHGSERFYRSDKGSEFAVNACIETISRFLESIKEKNIIEIENYINSGYLSKICREIVITWNNKIEDDLKNNPDPKNEKNITIPYGATSVTFVLTSKFLLYLQIGDGDIVTVDKSGKASLVFKNDNGISTESESLCQKDSWNKFKAKIEFIKSEDSIPELITVSSDGYSGSFANDETFLSVIEEIFNTIRTKKFSYIKDNLEAWLKSTSADGSGDDISLGLIYKNTDNKSVNLPEEDEGNKPLEVNNHSDKISFENQTKDENFKILSSRLNKVYRKIKNKIFEIVKIKVFFKA